MRGCFVFILMFLFISAYGVAHDLLSFDEHYHCVSCVFFHCFVTLCTVAVWRILYLSLKKYIDKPDKKIEQKEEKECP